MYDLHKFETDNRYLRASIYVDDRNRYRIPVNIQLLVFPINGDFFALENIVTEQQLFELEILIRTLPFFGLSSDGDNRLTSFFTTYYPIWSRG